jgi:hypothetical protein
MAQQPIFIQITAHETPCLTDPPNADEFYAALGMLAMAWGRLEGHVIGNLLDITNFNEMQPKPRLPKVWEKRQDLWTRAFTEVEALRPHRERALALMGRIVEAADGDRNFTAHAIWGEFVKDAPELTIPARIVHPKRGSPNTISVTNPPEPITLSRLREALARANQLNIEMGEFTGILRSFQPPREGARML